MKNRVLKLIFICVYFFGVIYYTSLIKEDSSYKEYIVDSGVLSLRSIEIINDSYIAKNYYEGEKIDDIIRKVNKLLNSTLKNKGEFIVKYSIEKGVDPYLSSAVILHETGCEWTCSYLARECNNFGGNKGTPSCNGGSYRKFKSQEDGLKFAIDKLASYHNKGLVTPEQIGPKYATSTAWSTRVNKYINKIKKQ